MPERHKVPYVKRSFLTVVLLLGSFYTFSQSPGDTVTAQKTVYLFSGLGADPSPFVNLELPGYHKVYISWLPPLPDETLTQYAGRIKNQITAKDPYIIGLSFGGVIAVEVARQMEIHKMVLISSARTRDDLNRLNCFFMKLGLYRIIPRSLLKHTNFVTYHYFGAYTEEDKEELAHILGGTEMSLFRWGLKSIAGWDNREMPERTIEIHGTADKVIAYRFVRHPDYSIKGGGHLMVFNRADTISKIIVSYFEDGTAAATATDAMK